MIFSVLRLFVIFAVSFITTLLILPKLRVIASKIDLLDYPNERKVHVHPKPLIGGLGIITAISICGFLFIPPSGLQWIYAGIIMLTAAGFIDDVKDLNQRWKFAVQILAAMSMVFFSGTVLVSFGDLFALGPIGFAGGMRSIAIPLTIFCTVGVVNAVNMIDGLDGLLGGVSLTAFLSFAALAYINGQTELMLLSIAFSGALVAFLRYNWRLSELFMGDAGSLSIGFTLVFLSVAITQKENSLVPPVAALLILAVPIVDTIAVMITRMMKGKSPFRADKNHLHHILLRFGFTKESAVRTILSLSAGLASVAILGTVLRVPDHYLFSIFLTYTALYLVAAAYIKDVLKAKMRMKRGRMEYRKPAFPAMMIMHVLDALNRIKRKYERYLLKTPVICPLQEKSFTGTVLDIGWGGFSARFAKTFQEGQQIQTNILLMDRNRTVRLSATAEVAWSLKSSEWCSHGFKFIGLNHEQVATLKNFLGTSAAPSADDAVTDKRLGNMAPGRVRWSYAAEKLVTDKSGKA